MKEMGEGWTEERTETLKRRWLEGASAGQIAFELAGGVSRNAVIGKIHRLKLPRPNRPRQQRLALAVRPSRRPHRPAATSPVRVLPGDDPPIIPALAAYEPEPLPAPISDDEEARVALVDLTSRSCRWPIGDPKDADFGFCGQPIVDGKTINEAPYCARHTRRAKPA